MPVDEIDARSGHIPKESMKRIDMPSDAQPTRDSVFVIAHVSDLHLDGHARSIERTRAVMDYLNGLPFDLDVVLVTGDIADHGLAEEYADARELLTSRHPVLACPGNHDDRAAFRQGLLDRSASTGPINQVYSGNGFAIALCDSSIAGRDDGYLDDETIAWLEQILAETAPDLPVVLAFHHPPTRIHIPFIDDIRQFGEDRLARLIEKHPNIAAVLCGHAHSAATTTFAGRPLIVAPGVVSTLLLPWETRRHPQDFVRSDLPPAVAFHVLEPSGRLTTHYRSVPVPAALT